MYLQFLKLELKNSIKAVRKTITGMIIAILLLTVAAAAVSFVIGYDDSVIPLKAAIILHDDDSLTRMLVRYVSQTDSIKSISEFEYMDEEEAFASLDSKDVDIVIDLPADFYNDVNSGINTPLDIHMRDDADILSDMFVETVISGTGYVRTTEAAVYAFIDESAGGDHVLLLSDAPIGDHIAMLYANRIMHRLKIFDTEVVSEFGALGAYRFYFMAFLMIILLYSGMSFGYLYDRETLSVEDKLKVYGLGRIGVTVIKETVMTLNLFLLSLLMYFAVLLIQKPLETEVFRFTPVHLPVMLGLCVSVAVLYNMIYVITGDDHDAQPVILMSVIVALLLAGIIIPYTRMPSFVSALGRVIPLTYMKEYFTHFFYEGAGSLTEAVLLLPIVIAEQLAGVLWARR